MSDRIIELIDENADGNTYFGEGLPGALTSEPKWKIQRLSKSGTVTELKWADRDADGKGDNDFSNVWDNRTSLTYA